MDMTADTAEIISVAESLPIEMRLEIVNRLLESIQPTRPDVDRVWIDTVRRRSDEIKSGKVEAIRGDDVRKKVEEKFSL